MMLTWPRTASFDPRVQPITVAVLAFLVLAAASHLTPSVQYNDVLQANAWLHGHIPIDRPGGWIDAIPWRGGWYVIEAPFPSLLMVPLVLVFGPHANQTLLSAILGSVAIGAGWTLCARLGTSLVARIALVAFLALGTDLFWCAALGDVWFVAHVSAVCFTLLAFVELTGKRRGWVVALFAAAAGLSRYPLLPAILVYPFLLNVRRRPSALLGYAAALVPVFAVWVWYNEVRWGAPIDIGYALFYAQNWLRTRPGSPPSMASLQNVVPQLWNLFVYPPVYSRTWPWVAPDTFGLALTYTSPALVCALFARRPPGLVLACWILALGTAVPTLLYYDGGGVQFGMRHALDFEPFLFVLMVLGVGKRLSWWAGALIAWSVAVGSWGLWYWLTFSPGK
ncbi:MAG TPA: hypothetical protein VHT05_02730 [Candidatus Elarobacter sp.]|nr:hypothetical protein [Candidatus Elarobacter sp.]